MPSLNMEVVVEYLNNHLRPDLVVNTGDIVILDADSAEDRDAAGRLHQKIGARLRVVPGNPDVGEPGEGPWMGMSVTSERVAAFKQVWGADRERLTSTFRGIRLRVVANGHVHRYQNVQEEGHLSFW